MADNGESLDNINDFLNLEGAVDGEEDNSKDLETFGDIGPLTNEWEDKHQQLAGDIERERHAQVLLGDSATEAKGKFDASQYAFFGGGENLELGGNGLDDPLSLEQVDGQSTGNEQLDKMATAFGKLSTTHGSTGGQLDENTQMSSGLSPTLPGEVKWYNLPNQTFKDGGHGNKEANTWQMLPEQQQQQYTQPRVPEMKQPNWWEDDSVQKQGSYHPLPGQLPLSHAGHPGYQGRTAPVPPPGLTPQQFQYLQNQASVPAGQSSMPHSGGPALDSHALPGLQGMDMTMMQQHHQRLRPHVPGQFRQQQHQLPQRPMGPPPERHHGHNQAFAAELNGGQRQATYQNYNAQVRRQQAGPMRSKYMTHDEIENLMRMQWSATHTSDPYIDDYYHQAMQHKLAAGTAHGRRNFAPSHLREIPSHAKIPAEQPAFLALNGLGRLPFANVRRPRPLLDMEPQGPSEALNGQMKAPLRPLEQEPMLYARMVVDEGLCISLDIDDIDRTLANTSLPDGGHQLRRQRQVLLELLAHTLQLTDDSSQMLDGRGGRMRGAKDEFLFLRLCSLSKGKKLLTRYLQLVNPSSDLARMAAVAVMRHLRFLFGGAQTSDPNGSTNMLAAVVANAGANMDLPALSACLAAVVVATDQPPLRPMGAPAGDGATIILKTLLDRATQILQERGGSTVPVHHQAMWQASFDAFFLLLSKYCANKYESILSTMAISANGDMNAIASAAATAMGKEMPVEILFASLPHTNDHQRKLLLDFTQRSMGPFPAMMANETYPSAAPVRC